MNDAGVVASLAVKGVVAAGASAVLKGTAVAGASATVADMLAALHGMT